VSDIEGRSVLRLNQIQAERQSAPLDWEMSDHKKEDIDEQKTRERLARYLADLRRIPYAINDRMPTKLGNVLHAGELWPREKYGLDTSLVLGIESNFVMARLWYLLPASDQDTISSGRNNLDLYVHIFIWNVVFIVWAMWELLHARLVVDFLIVLVLWVLFMILTYGQMVRAATVYADLIEAAVDLRRKDLYEALRVPLPANALVEHAKGVAVMHYLWYGSTDEQMVFEPTNGAGAEKKADSTKATNGAADTTATASMTLE
jgi:hypothetical protein